MCSLVSQTILFFCTWVGIAFPALAQLARLSPQWANQYDQVRPSALVYIVAKKGKMGVVDRNGMGITPLDYDTIYNFREGMAIVGKGKREVNPFGKVLTDFKYGYINQQGRPVIPFQYELVSRFSEGLAHVVPSLREDIWFNKAGKPALVFSNLTHGGDFEGGMAYVMIPKVGFHLPPDYPGQPNPGDIRGNFIDHQGRLLVPTQYDSIAPYRPGSLRLVGKNGKWGFLDSLALIRVALQYTDIDPHNAFGWQNLKRVGKQGRFGFINPQTGEVLITPQYEATKPSKTSLVWVRKQNRWGCINRKEQLMIPFAYEEAHPFAHQVSIVKKGGHWGLIDVNGQPLTPFAYESIDFFQDGRARAKKGGKYGFLSLTGQEIIPTQYTQASLFQQGRAYATQWGLLITLDQAGHWSRVKPQSTTLQWLLALLILGVIGLLLWRKQRAVIDRHAAD